MLNQVTLIGRFTAEPEVRYTKSQVPVAHFTLAVERDGKADENGNRKSDFIDCVAFRNTATYIQRFFHKGTLAVVSGALRVNEWKGKAGEFHKDTEVAINDIFFCPRNKAAAPEAAPEPEAKADPDPGPDANG